MKFWSQAKSLAEKTPEARNRYVDFLLAVSITVVIVGHWLVATAYYADGNLVFGHLLKEQREIHWLTWLFQVMPIFFIVGGYANGVSLESAERKGQGYAGWLVARLHRLVTPLLLLIVTWGVVAGVHACHRASSSGFRARRTRTGPRSSRAATRGSTSR